MPKVMLSSIILTAMISKINRQLICHQVQEIKAEASPRVRERRNLSIKVRARKSKLEID